MPIFLQEKETIYFAKTREYFQEVVSSYSNGNYRSANVMLYSVAICDILLKLQELKDMYNDTVATEILASYKINSEDKSSKSKSAWEKDLIDSVYKKTELLDLEAYTHLNRLYEDRNFSAHPALNKNFELISPSQETTIANIKNILNEILVKPPIFVTKIIDTLLSDLAEKKSIFEKDWDNLSVYLNNKFFSRMPKSMKTNTFRSLWKLCFKLPEDDDCNNNRLINRKALEILSNDSDLNIESIIKNESQFYTVAIDKSCGMHLVVYLSRFPEVYPHLALEVKAHLDKIIDDYYEAKVISWFKANDLSAHIDYLLTNDFSTVYDDEANYLYRIYSENGCKSRLMDYFIEYFSASRSYDTANDRYEVAIKPFLDDFSKEQFELLFDHMNSNDQIFNRNAAYMTNTAIIRKYTEKFGLVYDSDNYTCLRFDKDILSQPFDENEEFEEIDDDDDLPF